MLAALSMGWSNGQIKGQVNRLKLLKRQMYERAKFDLLRKRVLHRASLQPDRVHQKGWSSSFQGERQCQML